MNIRKSILTLSVAACVLTLSACLPTEAGTSSPSTGDKKTSTTAAPTTKTTISPENINPLTGLADIKPGNSVRPVAVMIGNNGKSRPQAGIDKADMYIEAETEGGITRIMAVFSGVSRVPEKLGPIRSARTPFILIAESLDSIYCHAGGSITGKKLLQTAEVGNIDALYGVNNSAFWRDPTLRSTKGLEYSMMTAGTKLSKRIKSFKFHTGAQKPSPFSFGKSTAGTGAGSKVQIHLSSQQTVSFTYDAVSGLYYKKNGTLQNGGSHKTLDGVSLTATSIFIMYAEKYTENERTIGFKLEGGTGLLITENSSRQIRWSRTKGRLSFTEYNGTKLNIKEGKPYICLTDTGNASKTIVS